MFLFLQGDPAETFIFGSSAPLYYRLQVQMAHVHLDV